MNINRHGITFDRPAWQASGLFQPGARSVVWTLAVCLLLVGALITAGCGSDNPGTVAATQNGGGHYEGNAGSVGTVSDSATGTSSGPAGSTVNVGLPPQSNGQGPTGPFTVGFYPETAITGVNGTGNVSPVYSPISTQATNGQLSFDLPLLLPPGTYEIQISSQTFGGPTYNTFTFTVTGNTTGGTTGGGTTGTGGAKA